MAKKEELEIKKNQQMSVVDFESDAGQGTEGADKDSFAIPFLIILQPMSPQITEETVPGAKQGMFYNTVTNELFKEVDIIPVAFQRRFLVWQSREEGGGFRGAKLPSEVETMVAAGKISADAKGKLVDKDGLLYKDTRQHYVLHRDTNGTWVQAMIAMSSTQIKRSKRWMSQISAFQMPGKDGTAYNPPSFSRFFHAKSEKETNDQGTWYSWLISPVEVIADKSTYLLSKRFHGSVVDGAVKVDYSQARDESSESAAKGF